MPEGPKAQKLAVVIPAGGVGTRFGGRLPKQFVRLGRGSILTETIAHFTRHPAVIAIVVAAPEIHVERTRRALAPVTRRAPVMVVRGGGMRQDSVWLALQAVPGHADMIVVHDAVRPLITRGLIDAVVGAAAESGAAVCALPITETIKRVRQNLVDTTLDRSERDRLQVQMAKFVSEQLPGFMLYFNTNGIAYVAALRGPQFTNIFWSIHEWELG